LFVPAIAGAQTGLSPGPLPSVTMEQAVDLAFQRNQAIRAERLNVDQSKANEITASLRPNLVFTSLNQGFPAFNPSQVTWDGLTRGERHGGRLARKGHKRGEPSAECLRAVGLQ
jgi:hypothetical protein